MTSKRQKSGTEASEASLPAREHTLVYGVWTGQERVDAGGQKGTTLPTPHSGVRIPASRTDAATVTSDKFRLFSTTDDETTVCDERTTLGLFVVPREPRTEPHLPVADPFEVAEQLGAIQDCGEAPVPPSSATRLDVSYPTFEDSGPPSATLCSPGVVRSESEIIAAPKTRSSTPPLDEVVTLEPMSQPPPTLVRPRPSPEDMTSLTMLGLPRPVFAVSRFGWLVRVSEWILSVVTFGKSRR